MDAMKNICFHRYLRPNQARTHKVCRWRGPGAENELLR